MYVKRLWREEEGVKIVKVNKGKKEPSKRYVMPVLLPFFRKWENNN